MGEITVKPRGILKVMGDKGDERVAWDPDDLLQVKTAEARFKDLLKKRFKMFLMDATGKKGKEIADFDPSAGAILAIPPMVGG